MRRSSFTCIFAIIVTALVLWPALLHSEIADKAQEMKSPSSPPQSSRCFGSEIEKIDIPGLNSADQQMLRQMLPLHEGQQLERGSLQQSLRIMFATGRFQTLQAECDHSADGRIVLSFVSTPSFFIGEVKVEGAPAHPTDSQIVNASKLQLGEALTSEKIESAIQNIRRLMEENGFYKSAIGHSQQENPDTQQVKIAFQVGPGPAARVGKITIQGVSIFSRGQIEDIAHLHPGEIVTSQTTINAIDRIRKKYEKRSRWLAQVAVASRQYRPDTNTIDYTLQVDSGPAVQIVVSGFHLSKSTIKRNVPVYEEGALDDDLLNEGQRNLLGYLESRGYFDARVELKRESDPERNMVRVIYQITPGDLHKVVEVEVTGNKYFRLEDLRAGMQVQASSWLLPHGRYSEALLRGDVRDITNKYLANGFSHVKVESHAEDDYHGKDRVAVFIHINEGPQALVGSLRIEGNTTQPASAFPPLNTQPGQPFSDVNVAQDRDILLNYYFNNGYPNATFEASAKPGSQNRMDVVFTIHEGERVYIERVLIAGREYTRPYVINRELEVKAGDPLSESSLLDTQQRLYNLGIFSQVDTAVQNPDGAEPKKNVLVQLQEARRYTFNYGGGFEFQTGQPSGTTNQPLGSAGVSPLVSFGISRLNFLGRDHTVSFDSRVGGLQQRALVGYEAPEIFNSRDWKLTFTAFFDHTVQVTTFTSQRLEDVTQAEQVISRKADGSPSSLMDYRFNYRLVKAILNPNVEFAQSEIPLLSQPVRLGEPGFGYIRNHRDNDLDTTRGTYNTVDAGVASSYFGSQADFSHILVQNSTYHPFGKKRGSAKEIVFARSTRVGVESPFGNTIITQPGFNPPTNYTQIPLPERFFMGGGNSHRGFGLNQAGPRDPLSGFPVGGAGLFLNNLELRFPPPTLPIVQDKMSFAIFHDVGNVFTDSRQIVDSLLHWKQDTRSCTQPLNSPFVAGAGAALCNYNYLSQAIGLGIRYKTPVGPVRFDLGYNLNPTVFPNFSVGSKNSPAVFLGTKTSGNFNLYFSVGQPF